MLYSIAALSSYQGWKFLLICLVSFWGKKAFPFSFVYLCIAEISKCTVKDQKNIGNLQKTTFPWLFLLQKLQSTGNSCRFVFSVFRYKTNIISKVTFLLTLPEVRWKAQKSAACRLNINPLHDCLLHVFLVLKWFQCSKGNRKAFKSFCQLFVFSQGGSKVNSAFHPSEVIRLSTRNSWKLNGKK